MDLTEYLTRRDQLSGALGSRPARTSGAVLLGLGLFGAGLLVGSALALLLAPRNGAEVREELRSRMQVVRDRLRSAGPDGEDREDSSA